MPWISILNSIIQVGFNEKMTLSGKEKEMRKVIIGVTGRLLFQEERAHAMSCGRNVPRLFKECVVVEIK